MTSSNTLQKLRKSLESRTGKAIIDYNMIEDGDTVLVCVSGSFCRVLELVMVGDGRAASLIGKPSSLPCVVLPGEEIFDV
jgi:hypothetical protein